MMKTGDIVIVHYPFSDLAQTKLRPAVVVTITSDKHQDAVLCLISSVVPHKLNNREMLLHPNVVNNLKVLSVIKVYRVATVQQIKIVSVIGKLSANELKVFIYAFQSLVQQS